MIDCVCGISGLSLVFMVWCQIIVFKTPTTLCIKHRVVSGQRTSQISRYDLKHRLPSSHLDQVLLSEAASSFCDAPHLRSQLPEHLGSVAAVTSVKSGV